ncbi:hypothetical protein [Lysinibacillus antri]|uniref:Uncharacterized protein n=1 Tax=Lysinibacillus antri TaxID=2498145 RepID=A0A432LI10_9BACI|nr:hypothetical protein [Lysinibacillus antri]RUL56445.1 hypothetical protein EK386_02095 [Lysinibacillus antri]
MSKERTVISIWMNLQDEMERKMLDHVHAKGNRSKYIKRLIYDDLMEIRNLVTATTHYAEETIDDDSDSMEAFL